MCFPSDTGSWELFQSSHSSKTKIKNKILINLLFYIYLTVLYIYLTVCMTKHFLFSYEYSLK